MAEAKRRGYREDGIYFDHVGECRDSRYHNGCLGRWRGVVSRGFSADGKRRRKKVSGKTKSEVRDKLKALHAELDAGIRTPHGYTLNQAVADWLAGGLPDRTAKTIETNHDALRPVVAQLGSVRLTELTAHDVRSALTAMSARYSTRTLQKAHNCLTRVIRYAEAHHLVRRNVSALVDTPKGQPGRPSQSLTLAQATALLSVSATSRLHAFIVLCLLTGVRSEEARALGWDQVDLEAGNVAVWRSVRTHGDVKTEKSRRTLKLPRLAVEALVAHRVSQALERQQAGPLWRENGLVFATSVGTALDSHNVRRDFRKVCRAAGIGDRWVPKELRTSFVSMMSHRGVPVEEIARLAGHSSTRTTEVIYRRELRPVITTGAEVMDQIFGAAKTA
jgi:integrase